MSNQFEQPRSGDKTLDTTTHQKSNREGSWEPQRHATNLSDQSLAAKSPIDQIRKLYRTWADKPSSKEGDQTPSKGSSSSSGRQSFSFKRVILLGTIGALYMVSRAEAAATPENHLPGSTKFAFTSNRNYWDSLSGHTQSTSILGEFTEETFATPAAFAQAFPTLAKDLVDEPQPPDPTTAPHDHAVHREKLQGDKKGQQLQKRDIAKKDLTSPQSTVTETVTVPGPTETVHAEQSEKNSSFRNGALLGGGTTAALLTALCSTTYYMLIKRNLRRAQGGNMEMQ